MRAPLSIVLPTLQAGETLGPSLGALMPGLACGLIREAIVSDAGSSDMTLEIAEEAGARIVTGEPGRGQQIARGVEAAEGEWLLVLHADTLLSPDWPDAVRRHIAERPERAGWFRLAFDDESRAARRVAAWANWRSEALGLPYGDQGLLISAKLLADVGGYPRISLMEDVDLAHRLGRRRLAQLGATATTSAARYCRDGWLRRGSRNLGTLARWYLGVPPERLVGRYRR